MRIRVEYYGRLRELAGRAVREVELHAAGDEGDGGPTVADLLRVVREEDFARDDVLDGTAVAVGDELVAADRSLREADVVSLLPPVSGG